MASSRDPVKAKLYYLAFQIFKNYHNNHRPRSEENINQIWEGYVLSTRHGLKLVQGCCSLVPRPLISRDFILTEMVSQIQIEIMKKS